MILVFSILSDTSTSDVIDWLLYMGEDVYRINNIFDFKLLLKEMKDVELTHNFIYPDFNNIHSIWYRRRPANLECEINENIQARNSINKFFQSEQDGLYTSLCVLLSDKKWVNSYNNSRPNKILQLQIANKVGLNTPVSKLIIDKETMINFAKSKHKIIIKPIMDVLPIYEENIPYTQYTKVLSIAEIKKLPISFFPCLVQEFIEKNLEIRTFFIEDKLFSMAICSTYDKQTSIDFRKYNNKHPNRNIPYLLPQPIEEKIILLMHELKLNSGSLDLILSEKGEYYFLEVNPVGQFGMVSGPCNYNLEKIIAQSLANK
ncbi:MAG: grasp-with-spasm system ATP-grasp peptide maturase [Bacteroidales bacterium]|jgi:ATP-GRASP peptide maturase of grasp-with-spasm system|nr:grasp-with-spasm system ATP-grasp peptide maturase [Bacteroidales bacterium]